MAGPKIKQVALEFGTYDSNGGPRRGSGKGALRARRRRSTFCRQAKAVVVLPCAPRLQVAVRGRGMATVRRGRHRLAARVGAAVPCA
jgi:hypothetical protein